MLTDDDKAAARATALLLHLNNHGGSIVSTNDLTPMEIAAARAGDRMVVSPGGFGYVWLPKPPLPVPAPDTDAARLAAAFCSIADALEGKGSKPLPCSDADLPSRRLFDMLTVMAQGGESVDLDHVADEALTFATLLGNILAGRDAVDVLADLGLLDE